MPGKKPLDGFYEEGYHYYIEIRGNALTVRDYARRVTLETKISYDAGAAKRGERVDITLKDNVLSRTAAGEPFTWIKALYAENGNLEMDYYYTIMGDKHYTLKPVEQGPFDHLLILDREILPRLAGTWVNALEPTDTLKIRGNRVSFCYNGTSIHEVRVHAVAYRNAPERVRLVHESLTASDLGAFTDIEVREKSLETQMIVMDASTPLLVYLRKEDVGKVPLPAAAHEKMRNTMIYDPNESLIPEENKEN